MFYEFLLLYVCGIDIIKNKAMNRQEYAMMAELKHKIPPKKETPKGQKFHIGEIVRIVDIQNHPCRTEKEGKLAEIQYSYAQKYEGSMPHHIKSYSLKHLWEDNSSAWWEECQLELVKGIDEINEERDLIEYKRLKAKYESITNK